MIIIIGFIILLLSFIFSMLGLGGALLYIPVFKWFGYEFKSVAIPTGLLLNGVTALSATIYYIKSGMTDVKGAIPMVITVVIGAPLGALFTKFVPTETLVVLFAILMCFAGGKMLLSSRDGKEKSHTELIPLKKRIILTALAGFLIGIIAGLLGIGGGSLVVPTLLAIGYATKQAVATSSFVATFSSFSGFAGHVAEGHFNLPLMIVTLVAVIIGSQVGARIMKEKMKASWIKQIFGVLLIAVAIELIVKAF